MSSISISLPVVLAQLPYLAKIVSVEQNSPETQSAFAERLAQEKLRRASRQVGQLVKPQRVSPKEEKSGTPGQQYRQASQDEKKQDPHKENEDTPPDTPWAGTIINMKV